MGNIQLGRLRSVEIQEIWGNDQEAFSEWFTIPENIEYLNEVSGLSLKNMERELSVNPCKCILTAEEEAAGGRAVIECQMDASSPEHLGRIITYAASTDISAVVWIVEEAREEHKRAIQWLNKNITAGIRFFLMELHVYQIGNSLPAAVLQIVEQPGCITKSDDKVHESPENDFFIRNRMEFWTDFNTILEDRGKPFNVKKASSYPWYDVALGSSEARISIDLIDEENKVVLEVYIRNNKDLFDRLHADQKKIEETLAMTLGWERPDDKKACKITYDLPGLDFHDHSNYPELMNEIIDRVIKMRDVFKRYL